MAGEAPQAQHLKLSLCRTFQRKRKDGSRLVFRLSENADCIEASTPSTSLVFAYSTNACRLSDQEPNRRLYGDIEIVEGFRESSRRRGCRP